MIKEVLIRKLAQRQKKYLVKISQLYDENLLAATPERVKEVLRDLCSKPGISL